VEFGLPGMHPTKLQQTLGHTDFRLTMRYVNLAGVVFAVKRRVLEARLFE